MASEQDKFRALARKSIAQEMRGMRKQNYNLVIGNQTVPMEQIRSTPWVEMARSLADEEFKQNSRAIARKTARSALTTAKFQRESRIMGIGRMTEELSTTGKLSKAVKGLPVVALGVDLARRIKKARKKGKLEN